MASDAFADVLGPEAADAPPAASQRVRRGGKLEIGAVCAAIRDGNSLAEIARRTGVLRSSLTEWLQAEPERLARARDARAESAWHWDEKAEKLLADAKDPTQVPRARELAMHYRWRASKIAPRTYGDRLEVNQTVTVQTMTDEQLLERIQQLTRGAGAPLIEGVAVAVKGDP